MRKTWKEVALAMFLAWGMPWLIWGVMSVAREESSQYTTLPVQTQAETEIRQTVNVLTETGVEEMELTDYLTGVLLCEMPGQFHLEAKKAQAVVARTYTLRTALYKDKHENAAICTDPSCCQGYRDPQGYLEAGGNEAYVEEARLACLLTRESVLTYEGELIDATYFSCSGGQTEDAVAVWGADIPYLQSVQSPGEEEAAHYTDTVFFTPKGFQQALGTQLTGAPESWFGAVTYTEGGGVDTMLIGGSLYTGTRLRSLLGLRSTVFTVDVSADTIAVTTRGYGHRVGMSQYGAQAMAVSGSDYRQILAHYYLGTELETMELTVPEK